ncbi:MAG: YHYH protein [Flavobacteriaceae bacterium]|nr:YHYH protein [Flavobacteriaceae bacterium]
MIIYLKKLALLCFVIALSSCNTSDDNDSTAVEDCSTDIVLDDTRGACDVTLSYSSQYQETTNSSSRIITANNIPDHMVGLFGDAQGALNPNAIAEQNETYSIALNPIWSDELTPLLSVSGGGPQYAFGVLLNGVELDPVAAEPFPHEGIISANVNWEWNLEALNVNLGLDCNNAHVQPNGKYHYHSSPILFLENLNISTTTMTLIGYAADGYPIYYKYAYATADDMDSDIIEMTSSYQLKSGNRPGDGITAPCDNYNGIYSNDYEYIDGLGTLDEANGRTGVTPEYPSGTYYYMITEAFPSIPRYFRGAPSNDFKIGD